MEETTMSTAEIIPFQTREIIEYDGVILPFEQLSNLKNHSEWRRLMAEHIAMEMDYESFGVRSIYLIGSVEKGEAVLCSDIDLLLHVDGSGKKRKILELWLDGWSKALAVTNYLRTGCLVDDLLDVHFVTDEDIRNNDSFATTMRNPVDSCCLVCHC